MTVPKLHEILGWNPYHLQGRNVVHSGEYQYGRDFHFYSTTLILVNIVGHINNKESHQK